MSRSRLQAVHVPFCHAQVLSKLVTEVERRETKRQTKERAAMHKKAESEVKRVVKDLVKEVGRREGMHQRHAASQRPNRS